MRLRPTGRRAHLSTRLTIWSFAAALMCGLAACGGGDDASEVEEAVPEVLSPELLGATWPVRMVDATERAPFEANAGWPQLVIQREYPGALAAFTGGQEQKGVARVHLELAAAYRQAALINAEATRNVFGQDRRDEDPAFTHCLRAIAEAVMGEHETAQASHGECGGDGYRRDEDRGLWVEAQAWAWSNESGTKSKGEEPSVFEFTDQFSALQTASGTGPLFGDGDAGPWKDIAGTLPDLGALPHFSGPDGLGEGIVEGTHAGSLVALAEAHHQAALKAWPEGATQLDAVLAIWRLPIESDAFDLPDAYDDALVFGSSVLSGGDYSYLAALTRTEDAKMTTDASVTMSPLAAALAPCLKGAPDAKPTLEVECVVDTAAGVHAQIRAEMVSRAGEAEDYHRPFYDLARVSVLRAAAHLAEANGEELTMGRLRILALERSTGPAADPVPLLQLAAWDAGNRNVVRAQELLHAQVGHLPGIEAARYPLDSLHVRLSRESAPGVPVH